MPSAPLPTMMAIRMNVLSKLPLESVSKPMTTGNSSPYAEKNVIMTPVAAPVRSPN